MNQTWESISGYITQDDSELSGDPVRSGLAASWRFIRVWSIAP